MQPNKFSKVEMLESVRIDTFKSRLLSMVILENTQSKIKALDDKFKILNYYNGFLFFKQHVNQKTS